MGRPSLSRRALFGLVAASRFAALALNAPAAKAMAFPQLEAPPMLFQPGDRVYAGMIVREVTDRG